MTNPNTTFSSSTEIGGGDPGRDYNTISTDRDNQPAGDSGNFGGGIGDRTQGAGEYAGGNMQDLNAGDQYGSSGGYLPKSVNNEPGSQPLGQVNKE